MTEVTDSEGTWLELWSGQSTLAPAGIETLSAPTSNNTTNEIHVADLNRDGALDLVEFVGSSAVVRLNRGDASRSGEELFLPGTAYVMKDGNMAATAVGDVNDDGLPDLVATYSSSANALREPIHWRAGLGDGTFAGGDPGALPPALLSRSRFASAMAIGDLDGDGNNEIAVSAANTLNKDFFIYWGNAGSTPTAVRSNFGNNSFNGPTKALFADVDNDLRPDLLIVEPTRGVVIVRGGNRLLAQHPVVAVPAVKGVAAADLDGDGDVDLALSQNGRLVIAEGQGNGTFVLHDVAASNAGYLVIADFDGDGFPDVAGTGAAINVYAGRGDLTFDEVVDFQTGRQKSFYLTVADFEGDGVPGLAWHSEAGIELWRRRPGRVWRQELREMLAPSIAVGGAPLAIHQAKQNVRSVGVRVRLEGQGLAGVSLTLTSPRGEQVLLTPSAAPAAGLTAYSGWFAPATLAAMNGWQPTGEWVLTAAGPGTARVADFRVITEGLFVAGP